VRGERHEQRHPGAALRGRADQVPQGSRRQDPVYVEGAEYIRRLNDAFDGEWSFEIVEHHVRSNEVVVIGKLTAGSVVKTAFGGSSITRRSLGDETREVVMVLALDTKRRLVTVPITVAIGTNDAVPVHPREIFRPLIKVAASSCLIAHLHPSSGEPVPSPDDVMMIVKLKEAGELRGIAVVDHIVLGRGCYISMAERGLA
jgi:DNA repair protein RadC